IRVVVDARDKQNKPITNLNLRGAVTQPITGGSGDKKTELTFQQRNSGLYEVEFKAEEAGSYFITAQATKRVKAMQKDENGNPKEVEIEEGFDSIRSGVTIPYSPEFADLEPNTGLLERLRSMTDGRSYEEDGEAPAVAAPQGAHEIPVATPRPPRRPEPQRGVGPEQEKEAADYASRLLKAKKRVWEEREKDKQ